MTPVRLDPAVLCLLSSTLPLIEPLCDFVCGTTNCMSHAKVLLHWSVIHYQMTFERHSGFGSETSIVTREFAGSLCDMYQNHMYRARLNTSTCKTENMNIIYK